MPVGAAVLPRTLARILARILARTLARSLAQRDRLPLPQPRDLEPTAALVFRH